MSKKYILFDLDGTLTDSGEGILNCVKYALEKMGEPIPDYETQLRFIGPPLVESFREYAGLSPEDAENAVEIYRERYKTKGLFENCVYDGIPQLLEKLKQSGKSLLLATAKPIVFAERIMQHFDLAKYFDGLYGAELNPPYNNKIAVMRLALEKGGVSDLSAAVMVGDREQDVLGSKAVGIECVGVRYGYAEKNELENAGADYICTTVAELVELLEKI